jgi:hypothetical protein
MWRLGQTESILLGLWNHECVLIRPGLLLLYSSSRLTSCLHAMEPALDSVPYIASLGLIEHVHSIQFRVALEAKRTYSRPEGDILALPLDQVTYFGHAERARDRC